MSSSFAYSSFIATIISFEIATLYPLIRTSFSFATVIFSQSMCNAGLLLLLLVNVQIIVLQSNSHLLSRLAITICCFLTDRLSTTHYLPKTLFPYRNNLFYTFHNIFIRLISSFPMRCSNSNDNSQIRNL